MIGCWKKIGVFSIPFAMASYLAYAEELTITGKMKSVVQLCEENSQHIADNTEALPQLPKLMQTQQTKSLYKKVLSQAESFKKLCKSSPYLKELLAEDKPLSDSDQNVAIRAFEYTHKTHEQWLTVTKIYSDQVEEIATEAEQAEKDKINRKIEKEQAQQQAKEERQRLEEEQRILRMKQEIINHRQRERQEIQNQQQRQQQIDRTKQRTEE